MADILLFEEALIAFDVPHKKNDKSIILKTCPHCGNENYKLWMFRPIKSSRDPLGSRTNGACWVCGTKVTSFKYLLGFASMEEVKKALGFEEFKSQFIDGGDLTLQFDSFLKSFDEIDQIKPDPHTLIESEPIQIPAYYKKVSDSASSPEGKYAASRGVIGRLQEEVYIDPMNKSVVFPLWAHDETLSGFQERYVKTKEFIGKDGKKVSLKCKTSGGIKKSKSVIIVGNPSDQVCLVEGPFDAVAAVWFGYCGICTLGATGSREQVQMAAAYAAISGKPLHIGYDQDKAGEVGARNIAKICDSMGIPFARVIPFAAGEDFSSMLTNHCGFNLSIQDKIIHLKGMIRELYNWRWDLPY
jgi:hypothetical protein